MDYYSELVDYGVQHKWWILGSALLGYVLLKLLSGPKNMPPGPWGLPIVGSLFEISEDTIHEDLARLGRRYGEIFSIRTGRQLNIILNSYTVIREAFSKRGSDFADRPADTDDPYNVPYDDMFIHHKKIGMSGLKNFGFGTKEGEEKMLAHVDQFVQYLLKQKSAPLDNCHVLKQMCTCMILEIVFAEHCQLDDPELNTLMKYNSDWVNMFFTRGVFMFFKYNMLPAWLTKLVYGKEMKYVDDRNSEIVTYMKEKIRKHMENSDPEHPQCLADIYYNAKLKGESFSFGYLVSTVLLFIPDAIDTSANQINWMLLILAQRPELQEELQDELHEVIGERPITYSDRGNLIKFSAFILEGLRFSSLSVTSLPHAPLKDDLTFRGYNIPKEAAILANVYPIHFDPEYFPEPFQFRLDHFLTKDNQLMNQDRIATFSIGRRMCMGEQYARAQLLLTVGTLLQKFTFQLPEGDPAWNIDFRNTGGHFRKPPSFNAMAVPRH